MGNKEYFLGLDIGTDSVGYAVTDTEYSLLKFRGEPAWGVTLFDKAQLNDERRAFRTARRRLDRRQQRVKLLQELFAPSISQIDPKFFERIRKSNLCRDDKENYYTLFDDEAFNDKDYNKLYPTVHHLIYDLMTNSASHDVRLVYVACAWLVAHRGHFLSDVSMDNIANINEFSSVWSDFNAYFKNENTEIVLPWNEENPDAVSGAIRLKKNITAKYKALCSALYADGKSVKTVDSFPYNCEVLFKGICGAKIDCAKLFNNDEYKEVESFSLSDDDEKLEEVFEKVGDDAGLLIQMKKLYDWALLADILAGAGTISEAKVHIYDTHAEDLKNLKYIIRKYLPDAQKDIFDTIGLPNYAAYTAHWSKQPVNKGKKVDKLLFSDWLRKQLEAIKQPDVEDEAMLADMLDRLSAYCFLPKQHDTDNRVIPYQLYLYELNLLLEKASAYLPFLAAKDEDDLTVADKIKSVFTFRIPYYVGPLNHASEKSWFVRKANGAILPWNFDKLVDKDASETEFIRRMTGCCTYLPSEKVIPKDSLLYHRFEVLNEINNLKVDGKPISVRAKQTVFSRFEAKRKVTVKDIRECLLINNYMQKDSALSGVDTVIKSDLKPQHDFHRLLSQHILTEEDVEKIILQITCTEDKARLKTYLTHEFPALSDADIKYICRLNYKDFGRLSTRLLTGLQGVEKETGEVFTVIRALWETNNNLMELLSDRFTFREEIERAAREHYAEHPSSLSDRLSDMYLSNAVKRPVLRALEITREVTKAFGAPAKIFVEMTRGASEDQKHKRTISRYEQIKALYETCEEDTRELEKQLESYGDSADTLLQSDRLFLYYMQLGRCMYTGQAIDLAKLKDGTYNIEHIYPQSKVKDDSILNNEVLVLSTVNGQKSDQYPIDADIRIHMHNFWSMLYDSHLITEEKFKRLTRFTPFIEEEEMGFINRQLTETSQSVKAVAQLLKEAYPDTEIVYVKARLTSDFRQEFDLLKSRTFNDLHHAKDAYLNIVTGNVYDMKFSKRWFSLGEKYNVQVKSLFTHELVRGGKTVWDPRMLDLVRKTVCRNTAHMTKYSYIKKSGLFDQMPVKAASGLVPLKAGLPTEKYGGYNKPSIAFFMPVKYTAGKKSDVMIMSVETMYADKVLEDQTFRAEYASEHIAKILGKAVSSVSFPLGMRVLKINTILSLDGFRVCIAGSGSGGRGLITAPFMSFSESHIFETYMKRLEMFVDKASNNSKHRYDAAFDKVTREENLRLYDIYIKKLENSIYSKRPNCPLSTLVAGRDRFSSLDEIDQAKVLLNIHGVFGRLSSGCDLLTIGGASHAAATVNFSANMTNWKKNYSDVRIVNISASGLWESQSGNLLELV